MSLPDQDSQSKDGIKGRKMEEGDGKRRKRWRKRMVMKPKSRKFSSRFSIPGCLGKRSS
jgi:hypothetical protein